MRRQRPKSYWIADADRALTRAEAGELARRAADGDAEARWALARSVAPLLRRLGSRTAYRFGRPSLSWELADAGLTEFWARCHLYDPTRGTPGTFAERVAWHGFRGVLRDLGYPVRVPAWAVEPRGVKAQSIGDGAMARAMAAKVAAEPVGVRPNAFDVPADDDADAIEAVDREDYLSWACGFRKRLTPRERRVLAMRFRLGRTQRETGTWIGVSHERVRQIENEAIGKLRKAMGVQLA